MYNNTLGMIYNQNRKSFEALEETIVKIFDKNSETLKNKMKDSTGQSMIYFYKYRTKRYCRRYFNGNYDSLNKIKIRKR